MARKSPRNDKSSIKYRWISLDVPCIDPPDTASARGTKVGSCSEAKCDRKTVASCSNWTVTTPEFISTVGGLWRNVCQPVNVSQTKAGAESTCLQGENGTSAYGNTGSDKISIPMHSELSDPKSIRRFSPTAKSDFEHIKKIKRMLFLDPCWAVLNSSFKGHKGINGFRNHASDFGHSHQVDSKHEKIEEKPPLNDRINLPNVGCELMTENCAEQSMVETDISDAHSAVLHSLAANRNSYIGSSRKLSWMENGANCNTECLGSPDKKFEGANSFEGDLGSPDKKFEHSSASLDNACLGPQVTGKEGVISISSCPGSNLHSNCNAECLSPIYLEKSSQPLNSCPMIVGLSEDSILEDDLDSDCNIIQNKTVACRSCSSNVWLSVQNKIEDVLVKGKHAIAGGMSGIFVSLLLHPIDTVKTVIQADGMYQKPILHTIKSIISERGVFGLYRGIASNIASSAPISAVYTFTYESVKETLLPVLPKEYHSLAHCTAGGCASIATSFIFTPSERIKQQMQVHSCYQNSWNALIGVLEKGGLPSLYAGWSAVLCRNIPHSIIKFYTYERLKQLMQRTTPDGCLNPLQTLVCGGLAGSTAALFTTPFDVVKTRLQAEMPGSLQKYDGVVHVLKEIAKYEGINGLYRGLAPRLFMYVSQGAIFFVSYEFLKAALSFQGSVTRTGSSTGKERYVEDD